MELPETKHSPTIGGQLQIMGNTDLATIRAVGRSKLQAMGNTFMRDSQNVPEIDASLWVIIDLLRMFIGCLKTLRCVLECTDDDLQYNVADETPLSCDVMPLTINKVPPLPCIQISDNLHSVNFRIGFCRMDHSRTDFENVCRLCDISFIRNSDFKRHMDRKHILDVKLNMKQGHVCPYSNRTLNRSNGVHRMD